MNSMGQDTIKFSVIVPVYNAESFLEETIKSVQENGYENFELVLVNDGSKDRSAEICKEYAAKDSRIVYCEKENGGVASARNVGIKAGTGDYYMFLDSDDMYRPGLFAKIAETIRETDCDICQYGFNIFSDTTDTESPIAAKDLVFDEKMVKRVGMAKLTGNYIKPDVEGYIVNNSISGTMSNSAIRADIIRNNNIEFFSFWNNEDDWIFVVLCYRYASKVVFLKDCYYRYRKGHSSISTTKRYIIDIYKKRKASLLWINEMLDAMDVDNNPKVEEYKGILQRKMLLYTLYNESAASKKVSLKDGVSTIRHAVKTEKKEGFLKTIKCNAGTIEKVFFFMITHGMTGIAFLANKLVLKRYR